MSLIRKTFINRNRINRFLKLNTDEWSYELFNLDNLKIHVKDFNLHGKCVSFSLHAGNCHAIKDPSKQCSLFLQGLYDLRDHKEEDKSNPRHCPYINQLMLEQPERMFPIYFYKNKCRHYGTGQGQHRICISGVLGKALPKILLGFERHINCGACNEPDQNTLKSY
ncbi:hypothetical protein DMN77_07585 [Paenibacillus sp. 79R4]|nr:hypothetical protein [Paenibacillus sp. 79R4]